MKSVIRNVVLLGLATASVGLGGCSSAGSKSRTSSTSTYAGGGENVGIVGMQLVLPGGLVIDQLSYTISGPATYAGTVNVQGAQTAGLAVANVAPGGGYILAESATSVDGAVVCAGRSAPFTVSSGQTTSVAVALACTTSPEAGAVVGTTVATECATWTSAFATPGETTVGSVSQISAAATAPNPAALTYAWTASAGTIDTPNQASTNFTCPSTPGQVTITLTVADGPIPAGGACPASDTTTTLLVTCDAVADAGAADSGSDASAPDAGPDASSPLVPCTAPDQTGCVPCSGNAGGVCSATEALFVGHDIAAGNAATTPCYSCLLGAGCIDDTQFADKGNECDDLAGTFNAGAQPGTASSALCLATVTCVFGSSCAASAVSACYCGSFTGTACLSAPTPDGACYAQEVAGLGLSSSQAILESFTNTTLPSGMANQLFQCALSNQCTACLR